MRRGSFSRNSDGLLRERHAACDAPARARRSLRESGPRRVHCMHGAHARLQVALIKQLLSSADLLELVDELFWCGADSAAAQTPQARGARERAAVDIQECGQVAKLGECPRTCVLVLTGIFSC
eukprot:6211037-Pleurochrysis_carterae.AAC.1